MNRGQKILQLKDDLQNSPEYELVREIRGHNLSVFIFDRNFQRLLHMHRSLSENPVAKKLTDPRKNDQLMEFLREIVRMIHNFVASAKSLIDHTRRIYNKQYKKSNSMPDYEMVINETFAKDPLSSFLGDLRRYCQHYKAPNIELEAFFKTMEHEPSFAFYLRKDDLLTFKDWTSPSKKFLNQIENEVDFLEVAGLYRDKVLKFHTWFNNKRKEIHTEEIERFQERENKLLLLELEDHIEFTAALSIQGFPHRKDDLFLPFFSPSDFDKLEQIPRESQERPLQAIKWIEERHFRLPDKIKERIIALYKLPDIIPDD